MHIRDGILGPEVCLVGAALATAAVGYSLRRLRSELADRAIPLTGMLAAVIFAGQMVNFPLFGLPVSGHLLGGVLAAVVLGPWAGCVALALVLVVQAILFADGGLLSLGVNILNMAVVGAWGGGAIYYSVRRALGSGKQASLFASIVAAYLSVLLAAALFCVEFALTRTNAAFDLRQISVWMLLYHALIAVGEAGITGAVVAFLLARRPELILRGATAVEPSRVRTAAWGLGLAAVAVALVASPWASGFDDGLEAVGAITGFNSLGVDRPLILPDYEVPLPMGWEALSVSLAGLLGTVVVLFFGWGLSRWLQRATP
ncbi:MAG TPA: energy-coupling factor ABC transporter permease [Planctomycetaceae bacterium]|nr:energy-coupling factor ABC transporter permease [Planctomycetaceae bacterium]